MSRLLDTVALAAGPCMANGWLQQRLPGDIRCSHRQVYFTDTKLLVEEIVLEAMPAAELRSMKRRK